MSPWGIERYVEWIFMAIYGKTWVFQQNVKSVLHWKSWQFFSLIKSFQHSFAFLPSWNTMEHWGFLCFRNFLPEKISSQWLSDIRNFQIIPQCTLVSYLQAFLVQFWLTLRESVALGESVPQVFSHWMNREMTQLVSPVIPKCFRYYQISYNW